MRNSNLVYFLTLGKKNFLILVLSSVIGLFFGYFAYMSSDEIHEYKISLYPLLKTENYFYNFISSEDLLYDFIRVLKEDNSGESINLPNEKLNELKKIKNNLNFLKERIDYEINIFHVSLIKKYKKKTKNKFELIQSDIQSFNELLNYTNNLLKIQLLSSIKNNPNYYIFKNQNSYIDFYSYLKNKVDNKYLELNKESVNPRDAQDIKLRMNEYIYIGACVDIFSQGFKSHLSKDYINNLENILLNKRLYLINTDFKNNLTHSIVSKNIYIYLIASTLAFILIFYSITLIIELIRSKKIL